MIHDQFIHLINNSVDKVFAMQPWKIEQEAKTEEESRNFTNPCLLDQPIHWASPLGLVHYNH
jgi:hypothetical protein